jgi:hypothetical protein
MIRQLDAASVYDINNYTVILERIKNNKYGTPRFRATIFYNGSDRTRERGATNWTFTGHYYSNREEAEWILNQVTK